MDINQDIDLVKRDGRVEKYNSNKLLKVVLWACDNDEDLSHQLITSIDMKINNRITIAQLYDELIVTAANLMSPIQRQWDEVAKNLLLMKIYKETYNLKTTGYYPNYHEVVQNGIENDLYDPAVFATFTKDEITLLGEIIEPDLDLKYTYKGLYLMQSKYCGKDKSGDSIELPQHTYLKIAIYSNYKENSEERLGLICEEYEAWSRHIATPGTPRVLNSSKSRAQLASCVLSTMNDETENITDTLGNLAIYSKFAGGLAVDVSAIRSSGSKIRGNQGVSNGPVPFLKMVESVVSGFNQGGARVGACVATYPFWHHDVMNLLPLNDAGGAEDNRARKLKYAARIHGIVFERVRKDQDLTLFNPADVPLLNSTYGKEFEAAYKKYEKDNTIRKKRISAREFMFQFVKYRKETGNTYPTYIDNINEQSVVGDYIGASNLCTEITVTSTSSKNYKNKFVTDEDGNTKIVVEKDAGEIGLCNLFSINLYEWDKLTPDQKWRYIYVLLRGADNVIDYQFYPVKEAKFSNVKKRPIGVGVSNYANLLASKKIKFTDEAAAKFTHEVFEELYYIVYSQSNRLARERGPFEYFKNTRWAQGETPLSLSILAKKDSHLNYPLKYDWDELSKNIKLTGVRFSLHAAIAPTATSGRVISATESTEPITEFFVYDEGTQSLPSLAPNLQNRQYYQLAYDIPTRRIMELAAIRQKFIDQGQSINTYERAPESSKKLVSDMMYAHELGVKSGYYLKTPKANYSPECESCT